MSRKRVEEPSSKNLVRRHSEVTHPVILSVVSDTKEVSLVRFCHNFRGYFHIFSPTVSAICPLALFLFGVLYLRILRDISASDQLLKDACA